jgi:hypothetical protein
MVLLASLIRSYAALRYDYGGTVGSDQLTG